MSTVEKTFGTINFQHNRYNPLKGDWVLVCPQRDQRPWSGHVEKHNDSDDEDQASSTPANDPLAPGAVRSGGKVNPQYTSTLCFDNDFPALSGVLPQDAEQYGKDDDGEEELFKLVPVKGRCRVIVFSPNPTISLPLMEHADIVAVIREWMRELSDLSTTNTWVQIFENKGAIMGCSLPHPHCQVWAGDFLPNDARAKHTNQVAYFRKHGRPLLLDYARQEVAKQERVILENDHWLVVVPFWATWPFETMLLPHRRHIKRLDELSAQEVDSLASIMKQLLSKYDNLFHVSFPYSMGWHGAPTREYLPSGRPELAQEAEAWQLHASYYPPLLRSATIKKHMVGYELLAQMQRDILPEKAAARLRDMSTIHYKQQRK